MKDSTPYTPSNGSADYDADTDESTKGKSDEVVAKAVFDFVNGAKAFADEMDSGDEVKLLRMRTKRNEIVIVPGKDAMSLSRDSLAAPHHKTRASQAELSDHRRRSPLFIRYPLLTDFQTQNTYLSLSMTHHLLDETFSISCCPNPSVHKW